MMRRKQAGPDIHGIDRCHLTIRRRPGDLFCHLYGEQCGPMTVRAQSTNPGATLDAGRRRDQAALR